MADYKPQVPFNVAGFLLIPTTTTIKGVTKKTFVKDDEPFFCSFRTFGGTERESNGVTVIENTAVIETWYDPKFVSGAGVRVGDIDYEILGTPENINMRNQYVKFKVRAIRGGA